MYYYIDNDESNKINDKSNAISKANDLHSKDKTLHTVTKVKGKYHTTIYCIHGRISVQAYDSD